MRDFLKEYRLHMGGLACLFLAVGGVLQAAGDDMPIDWNRTAMDVTIGISILGAAFKANKDSKSQ